MANIQQNLMALVFCTFAAVSVAIGLLFMKVSNIKQETNTKRHPYCNAYWLTGLIFLILNQVFNASK
jgi:SNF family Na+-dependent transporter